jgi:hypothetical protein
VDNPMLPAAALPHKRRDTHTDQIEELKRVRKKQRWLEKNEGKAPQECCRPSKTAALAGIACCH